MPRKSKKHGNRSKVVGLNQGSEISNDVDSRHPTDNHIETGYVSNCDSDLENCESCDGIMSKVKENNVLLSENMYEKMNAISLENQQLVNGICKENKEEQSRELDSNALTRLVNGEEGLLNGNSDASLEECLEKSLLNEVDGVDFSANDFKDNAENGNLQEIVTDCTADKLITGENELEHLLESRHSVHSASNGLDESSGGFFTHDKVTVVNSNLTLIERDTNNSCLLTEHEHEQKNEILVLRENLKNQLTEIARLKVENERLRNDCVSCDTIPLSETTVEIYEVQMAALEKTITQLQKEVDHYRDKMTDQDEFTRTTIYTLKKDLSTKLEQMAKQCEASEKEKESMVVKYALSEKSVLIGKKALEETEKKYKESTREKETLLSKIRALTNEKARFSQTVDTKMAEISILQRDGERAKEEMTSRDIKIKWAQNKLKTEMDAHKETQSKMEKLEHKLKEAREESDQLRKDCQEMIRTYQESEEIKSNCLDLQLREKETELELERQEKCDQEEVYVVLRKELEGLKRKHNVSVEENNALTRKVQTLERERLDYEENVSKLKEQLNEGHQELVDLHAKLAGVQNMSAQIEREKERLMQSWSEIERLRQANAELQIDMETCRRKEGELLEFTERLTTKNVSLVSDYNCMEAKFNEQGRELIFHKKRCEEVEQKCNVLETQVSQEQQQRKLETQLLARKLAEKTKIAEILNLKVEEQTNENKVIKKKNSFTVRELTREVQALRRRLESYEMLRNGHQEGQSLGSRTSSTNSLDKLGFLGNSYQSGSSVNKTNLALESAISQDSKSLTSNFEAPVEPTRQVLIERIVKLQWAHARKNEKIEFLEEHVSQLLKEIQRKSKLIQNYIMREDTGALATSSMDVNKVELAKKGGIMSSLYLSQQNDDGMTLDLSLEICQKLQAVLEDTLLKNITLKENIKILGDEIERLTKERKHLR